MIACYCTRMRVHCKRTVTIINLLLTLILFSSPWIFYGDKQFENMLVHYGDTTFRPLPATPVLSFWTMQTWLGRLVLHFCSWNRQSRVMVHLCFTFLLCTVITECLAEQQWDPILFKTGMSLTSNWASQPTDQPSPCSVERAALLRMAHSPSSCFRLYESYFHKYNAVIVSSMHCKKYQWLSGWLLVVFYNTWSRIRTQ